MARKEVRGPHQRRGIGEANDDGGGSAASAIIPLVNRFFCGSSGLGRCDLHSESRGLMVRRARSLPSERGYLSLGYRQPGWRSFSEFW